MSAPNIGKGDKTGRIEIVHADGRVEDITDHVLALQEIEARYTGCVTTSALALGRAIQAMVTPAIEQAGAALMELHRAIHVDPRSRRERSVYWRRYVRRSRHIRRVRRVR
jgi:hypothetical protein